VKDFDQMDNEFCYPALEKLTAYNRLNLVNLLESPCHLLRSTSVYDENKKKQADISSLVAKIAQTGLSTAVSSNNEQASFRCRTNISGRGMVLGLGGGEMNSYLISHFPNLAIDHVEAIPGVAEVAMEYFQFSDFICQAYEVVASSKPHELELNVKDVEFDLNRRNQFGNLSTITISSNTGEEVALRKNCRSNLVISDAFDFIHLVSEQIQKNEVLADYILSTSAVASDSYIANKDYCLKPIPELLAKQFGQYSNVTKKKLLGGQDLFYDYILYDVYDEASSQWDGQAFKGSSHTAAATSKIYHRLKALKSILRPFTGIAVFHTHKDRNYKNMVDAINEVFGKNQVITFELVENDGIILAGRDRYEAYLPETDDAAGAEEKDDLMSDELYQHYRQHLRYRKVVHPCAQSTILSEKMDGLEDLAKYLHLEEQNYLPMQYAINCATGFE
jgi:hypothetical protein